MSSNVLLKRKLKKKYGGRVQLQEEDGILRLTGELDSWNDIYHACAMAAAKNSTTHVVNDIRLKGADPIPMRMPSLQDKALEIPAQIGKCLDLSEQEAVTLYQIMYKVLQNVEKE